MASFKILDKGNRIAASLVVSLIFCLHWIDNGHIWLGSIVILLLLVAFLFALFTLPWKYRKVIDRESEVPKEKEKLSLLSSISKGFTDILFIILGFFYLVYLISKITIFV